MAAGPNLFAYSALGLRDTTTDASVQPWFLSLAWLEIVNMPTEFEYFCVVNMGEYELLEL
jgi:hypothetical protein